MLPGIITPINMIPILISAPTESPAKPRIYALRGLYTSILQAFITPDIISSLMHGITAMLFKPRRKKEKNQRET
jgi:hypothetical protein